MVRVGLDEVGGGVDAFAVGVADGGVERCGSRPCL